jgi:hypothetical protein
MPYPSTQPSKLDVVIVAGIEPRARPRQTTYLCASASFASPIDPIFNASSSVSSAYPAADSGGSRISSRGRHNYRLTMERVANSRFFFLFWRTHYPAPTPRRPEAIHEVVKEIFLDRKNQCRDIFRARVRSNFNPGSDTIGRCY